MTTESKLTSVRYGKTFNLGNYENERLDAYAEVQPGQDPTEALAAAKAFVEAQHQATRQRQELVLRADELERRFYESAYRLGRFERVRTEFVTKLQQLKDILELHGVKVEIPSDLLVSFTYDVEEQGTPPDDPNGPWGDDDEEPDDE